MGPGRRSRVLLVDDEPANLVALEAVLEPLGQELVRAMSGEEALRQLLRTEFAVILLDVRMPGLDGFETAALIKRRQRTRHLPIIFVTAISKDTEQVFRGYSEGAVDYLLKPYDPVVLRSKVAVFIDLHEKAAALEESEQRFRTAFDNAPSGMALISVEGRFVQVNRALVDMLGHAPAELPGSAWDSIMHPEERAQDRQALRELIEGERTVYRAERRCLTADGSVLEVALSVSPTTAEAGGVQQLIAQVEDVTDRQRAERERAERLQERAARAEAEAVAQMVRSVQSVSDTALAHLALDDLLPELLDRIAETLGAEAASVLLSDPDGEELVLRATRGAGALEAGPHARFGQGTFEERVARERRLIVIDDITDEGADLFDGDLRASGVRALMGVPLVAEGEVSGVLRVGSTSPNRFDDNHTALLALVADRAALAIGNARLYEREHGIVETLQRSLLPARLPQLPGISIAARYQPGGADVGGDWYDAIEQDGGVGIVMGDVVGHGIEAAATMGELRHALRAYALDGLPPGAVLGRLDRLVKQLQDDRITTLVYAVIDTDWTQVRFASAGHLPPLLLEPDGSAEFLWEGRSTPLGVRIDGEYEEGTARLAGGSTLVLYTDGLVEVRGEELLVGLERLRDAVRAGPTEPDALCDHVIESLLGGGAASDDVALLALRTMPLAQDLLQLELATDPSSLRYARRMLARWLEQAGANEKEAWEIGLASHEAFANAIEHAYRFTDALVRLEARLEQGEVALTISDTGDWREPVEGERGKGIGLMSGLMDTVSVEGAKGGTRVELRRRLTRDATAPVRAGGHAGTPAR
ncbi:MAG: SpoIIE family protein phosphatase [Actinomycetota bacterium]|nr:SpoIIE family protein phosphatase [Actinomycetota bacterium]